MVMGSYVAESRGGPRAWGRTGRWVAWGGGRILVRLGKGRSVGQAAGASSGAAPDAGRMVGQLLLLRVML